MQPQLAYLKAVVEGAPDIEAWKAWFERNAEELQKLVGRTRFLDLKFNRIKAIPKVLDAQGISFTESDRYAYLGGVEGRCRDCGAITEHIRFGIAHEIRCPNGCF